MISQTMNDNERNLRNQMNDLLQQCTEAQRDIFRLMYNHEGKHPRDVDGVRPDQIDNAFSQIERTLAGNAKAGQLGI